METITRNELKQFLDEKYEKYNNPKFIEDDPVSIPHLFTKKEDIEIAGFLTATIAWGNRKSILKNANLLMREMGYYPHEFIVSASEKELGAFHRFVHRTFNGTDLLFFLRSLQNIYISKNGMEDLFNQGFNTDKTLWGAIHCFRNELFLVNHEKRSEKHVANVMGNATGKRICMFLRWMIRDDGRGVDFGIWKKIPASALMLPLDVHTGNVSRLLGLLQRKQNDRRAVEELTANLRSFDSEDPVKYDFALFGIGVNKEFYGT
jgi:uncharacterized protein (TIGR02757 family)